MRQAYLICINALNDYVFYHVYTLFFPHIHLQKSDRKEIPNGQMKF